ncbi:MAG TPA: pyruvate ferredoxin oxidoreductase, partial [Gammaproteobacteria bacterium]|nr:pyruvate ferredoxin oxidoreductase [Gammaproteobacteria bacterium]
WEQLPETTQATLEQAGAGSLPGKPAAALMAQRFRCSLGAGDGAEPGSGERLALRLLLATAVARQQPLMTAFIADVGAVREKLSNLIRKMLADALPADDLDALATGLDSVDTRETDLTSFINETEGTIDARIDALRLRRLVSLAQKLRDLSWQLTEGRQGFGRAGLGLVLCSNLPAGWAGVFPDNPFAVPVTVDTTGDAAQYAAGLLQGQLQQALEGFVLMRKARVELESPADAARLWSTLDNLGWDDLTVEERALCPPVIVVGSSSLLAGRGLSQLSGIMAGNLPIKFIVFPELDFGLAAGANTGLPLSPIQDTGMDLALLTLAWRSSLNAQCSVGYPEHLAATVETALNFPGPALIQIHAPSPGRHGFPADQTVMQARLAVKTRTFPLFLYDPGAEGVFGSRFSLAENPDPDSGWLSDESGQPVTTAHWMLGERRFAQWLSRLPADAPDTLPLAEYLALPEMSRAGKEPFIPDSGMH